MSNPSSRTSRRCDAPAALAESTFDYASLAAIALERCRMPMCVTDPQQADNPIILANRAFLKATGYALDEVIGRNTRFLQGCDTDPAAVDRIRAAIAAHDELTIELVNYRRDGSPFWNRLVLSPIVDDAGRLIYYFAAQADVTAERRARELASRERALLREVDHRAKNALALVQGIVRMTRADDPGQYSRSVQGRVDALAQAHIILSDAEWHDVPLGRIVAAAAAPFGAKRISHGGPPVDIPAAHVQPLTLAFHELLTNAAQHGGLSGRAGKLELSWHTDGDQLIIEVAERGGPPADSAGPPGYGLTLVDASVRRQLRGTVDRSWHRRGLTTRMAFPRTTAAAAAQMAATAAAARRAG